MSDREPIHLISLGAGVQSSTMALMAAHGQITPMPTAAIFADTQAEPASVYKWLDWLEKRLPFPVHRVTKGNLTESLLRLRHKANGDAWSESNVPYFTKNSDGSVGQNRRQCTTHYKVKVIEREARKIAGIKRGQKTVGVVQWIGISLDEIQRMKQSRMPWIENIWPLVAKRMRRSDCLNWMSSNGYPVPPRSACVYCPFRSNREWSEMKTHSPEDFAEACRVDYALRKVKSNVAAMTSVPFIHRSCKPLEQVDFRDDFERGQLSLWQDECYGVCGN